MGSIERISILGVPVDVVPKLELEGKIVELLEKDGVKQIMFLNVWDLLKARRNSQYSECLRNADLIIPVSKSILFGAKFLKKRIPVRYNPFDATISILSVLESRFKTLYLLGGRKKALMAAEKNVRSTFKGLQLVGRYVGFYKKTSEDGLIEAVYKASPSLVLLSDGIRKKDCWVYSRRNRFNSSIFLYYRDIVGIFSKRVKRISDRTFENGLEIWGEILRNPLKLFLIFPYMWYIILLVCTRLFDKDN